MQKLFHFTNYYVQDESLKRPLTFFILSDVHFNSKLRDTKLARLKSFIRTKNPDYILLGGDLIDTADVVADPSERKRLINFLKDLTNIAPVLYGLGNHEFYHQNPARITSAQTSARTKDAKNLPRWVPELNPAFLKDLAKIKNLHLLNSTAFEDENVAVFGLTLDEKYFAKSYLPSHFPVHLPDPKSEKKSELIKSLEKHQKSFKNLPKNKPKLILIHSPVYLKDPDVKTLLAPFDFIISGHMHNGVVPPLLDELWPSDLGFISPAKKLLVGNTRRTFKIPEDKLITVGAVTTFSRPGLRGLNAPFPVYLSVLTLLPTLSVKSTKTSQKSRAKITRKYVLNAKKSR